MPTRDVVLAGKTMTDPADPHFSPNHEERERMIAVAAYYLAERRGFAPGREQQDWQQAERQIDRMLAAMTIRGIDRQQFEGIGMRNALRLWATDST